MNASTSRRIASSSARSFCTCSARQGAFQPRRSPNLSGFARKGTKTLDENLPQTELFHSLLNISPITSRPTLINENTARDLVRAWGLDKMHDLVVVEPYAGPGGLTRAMLELKNVKRVIAVEQAWRYLPSLQALQAREPDRLKIIDADPFTWEAYSTATTLGYFDDVPTVPWDQVHPSFFLATQLPNTRHGDQLFVQFLNCCANQMWLYQFGRFAMGALGPRTHWAKITAPPATTMHHKLAVLMPSLADIKSIDLLQSLSPPDLHFHRPKSDPANFSAILATPHVTPIVADYETLDFIAKKMFVTKGAPWRKAIQGLAPGAENIIPSLLNDPTMAPWSHDHARTVNDLTLVEWAAITKAFSAWPFRPKVLFDDGGFASKGEY